MLVSWEQLYRLPVVTELGTKIGIVVGIDIQTESHAVTQYHVKPGTFISGLLSKHLLISPDQIIDISERQMTVKENAVPVKARTTQERTRLTLATEKPNVDLSELD